MKKIGIVVITTTTKGSKVGILSQQNNTRS